MIKKSLYKHLLVGTVSAFVLSCTAGALEAQEVKSFDIEAKTLSKALLDFNAQSGIMVMVSGDLVEGKLAPAVKGEMDSMEALERILRGSGLEYQKVDDHTITVSSVDQATMSTSDAMADSGKEASFVLEEIVVTATRRSASMQDVPISINAFSGNKLEESGVTDVEDLQLLAAGLDVSNTFGEVRVALRGIGGTTQFGPGSEEGVAMHTDGVVQARRKDRSMGFYDIARIEVLRGPQGTLYGRNATGGSINIITNAPTETFEAGGRLTYGNYDLIETEGYASGPLIGDKLTGRLAFKTRRNDGYTVNIFDGSRYHNDDFAAVRGKLRFDATDMLRMDLTADYARDSGITPLIYQRNITNSPLPFENPPTNGFLPSGRRINQNDRFFSDHEVWGVSGKIGWDLGSMTLSSLTAYRKTDVNRAVDNDGSPLSILVNDLDRRISKQLSQELTLASAGESDLEWVTGLFYFSSNQSGETIYSIPTYSIVVDNSLLALKTDAYAVFGEVSYPVLPRATLTVGARYSYEEKSLDEGPLGQLSDDWGSFTPKVALSYAATDNLSAYVTFSKGFKAGGYNGAQQLGGAYDPEKVTSYEAGVKFASDDNRFRANGAVFYMDYTDLQLTSIVTDPDTGVTDGVVNNAAAVTIKGVEFDIQARPVESLSFDGNLSYLDANFDSFPNAINAVQGNATVDATGNRMPNAPKFSFNLSATYTATLGDWGFAHLRGEYFYKGRTYFTPLQEDSESQKAFGIVNARLTFEEMEGHWEIAFWAKNIADKLIANQRTQSGSALYGRPLFINYLPPRTYGVTVGYRF